MAPGTPTHGTGRLVDRAGRPGRGRRRLRLPARRRRPRRCRTRGPGASPTACTRCPGPSTPAATRGRTRGWTGRELAGRGDLRAAPGHLHARRDPGRGRRQARTTWRTSASTSSSCCRSTAFNGTHNWGYDGVLWYAVHEGYGGPAAYQRFVDAAHAAGLGRHPGRGLQPPRPQRQLPAAVRAVPQAAARATPGATPSTWTAPAPTRCAATSWTTPPCGCATTTWTGCGWTPCTRFKDERAVHLLEEFGGPGRRRRRRDRAAR